MLKKFIPTLLFVLPVVATAEPADTDTLNQNLTIQHLTVTGNRDTQQKMRLPQSVSVISASDIAYSDMATTADVLSQTGLLSVQKSQQGAGSPAIRGFVGSRILLVVDGVKMNNLAFGVSNLNNIIGVDPASLSRMEILYGPNSVNYGTDALGGVIVMNTPMPRIAVDSKYTFSGNALVRYAGVNNGLTLHADFNAGTEKFASYTAFTVNKFGDLRSGKHHNPFMTEGDSYIHRLYTVNHADGQDILNPNEKFWHQPGSGYNQYDFLQKFLYKQSDQFSHLFNFQVSTTNHVPRYDMLTVMAGDVPLFAESYYGPQIRFLGAYNFSAENWAGADKFNIDFSYQQTLESQSSRKLNDIWLYNQSQRIEVASLTTDWIKKVGPSTIHFGLDGQMQFLKSGADATDIVNGVTTGFDRPYPDGRNRMYSLEAFFAHNWNINSHWTLTDGVRIGYSSLRSQFLSDNFYPYATLFGKIRQDNPTYSLNLGLAYNPCQNWKIAINLATGYRVPNLNDLAQVLVSHPGVLIVPNPDLRPEQFLSADLNVAAFKNDVVEWNASVFGSYLFDAVSLAPCALYPEMDSQNVNIYANHNNRRAYVLGASTNLNVNFCRNLGSDLSLTYTYGNYLGDDNYDKMPLDHVAPLYGRIGIFAQTNSRRFKAEFFSLFNAKKPMSRYNLYGEDNIFYATANGIEGTDFNGMPAWFTLNLKASYTPDPHVTIQAGVDNLLDTQYRVYGAGINAPGRNIFASIRVGF